MLDESRARMLDESWARMLDESWARMLDESPPPSTGVQEYIPCLPRSETGTRTKQTTKRKSNCTINLQFKTYWLPVGNLILRVRLDISSSPASDYHQLFTSE